MAHTDPHPHKELLVVEGVISDLLVADVTHDLFRKIAESHQRQRPIAGVGAEAGARYGQLAEAASVAAPAWEEAESFFCLVDNQVICGTFGGASRLPIGRVVRAVVEKRGELLIAQAILSEHDGLLWTAGIQGHRAYWASTWKFGWWMFLLQLVVTLVAVWSTSDFGADDVWFIVKINFVMALFIFGFTWSDAGPLNPPSDPVTEIFRMLGFAEPERVNLNGYQYSIVHGSLALVTAGQSTYSNLYSFSKAVEDGKLTLADRSP